MLVWSGKIAHREKEKKGTKLQQIVAHGIGESLQMNPNRKDRQIGGMEGTLKEEPGLEFLVVIGVL